MPYYARTKGRTQEIPPDSSRSSLRSSLPASRGRSPLPPRTLTNHAPPPLPDLSADVRAALDAPKHDDVVYHHGHGFWARHTTAAGRGPFADWLHSLEEAAESVPPTVPALLAVLFLLVVLPLMIAWDVV